MSEQAVARFSLEPRTLEEAMKYADLLSKSSLVPRAYQGKPGDILIAIQMGQEVGLKPLQALQNISCVNGRPSLWGDAPLALVKNSGLLEDIREDVDETNLIATCQAKRKGQPSPIIRKYSKSDAERAKLWNKEGTWQTNPKRMLQLRARAFTLRDGFPDVLQGLSIGEEQEEVVNGAGEALPAPTPLPPAPKKASDAATSHSETAPQTPACVETKAKARGTCADCVQVIEPDTVYFYHAGSPYCDACHGLVHLT